MSHRNRSTHSFDKLLSIFVDDALWETNLSETYVFIHLLSVFSVERTPAATHLEQQYAQGPKIYYLRVSLFRQKNLGCKVFGCPTESRRQFIRMKISFRKTKIAECDVTCSI